MHILPDSTLFRQPHDNTGTGHIVFGQKVQDAQHAASLAVLKGEVARVAGAISYHLTPRRLDDDQVTMASYLADQKLTVPIASHYRTKSGTGPVDKWAVMRELEEWNFEPTRVEIFLKKKTRFNTNECYVEVTFQKK